MITAVSDRQMPQNAAFALTAFRSWGPVTRQKHSDIFRKDRIALGSSFAINEWATGSEMQKC